MAQLSTSQDILKEWAPLTDLLQKIPARALIGLFNQDVKLTCLDGICELIVLGTNLGIVYLYDRQKKELQTLRCDTKTVPITAVKIISTVDFMLACGSNDGIVSIYQIPKSHPDNLPESLKPKKVPPEQYSVAGMHKGPITTLEWSKNGMKLFSGDKNGSVVLTEFDFYMHLSKSLEIINDIYEIVQLSYHKEILLVSTTYRTIVCKKTDKWQISQVGKKDRKTLGLFGGIFHQNGLRPTDLKIYCTRPGLRIWEADIEGSVQQTLVFKDILTKDSTEIPLINPMSNHKRRLKPQQESTFGVLMPFCEDLLVTHSNNVLYVINPKEIEVTAVMNHLRNILDVATNKNEMFVLEGERTVLRIGFSPEKCDIESGSTTPVSLSQIPTAPHYLPLTNTLREFAHKLHQNPPILNTASIVPALPPLILDQHQQPDSENLTCDIHTDQISIIRAEEALESPKHQSKLLHPRKSPAKIVTNNINTSSTTDRLELYRRITEQQEKRENYKDDSILFKSRKKPRKVLSNATNENKTRLEMTTSLYSTNSSSSSDHEKEASQMSVSLHLPDLRSPESIQTDIEAKEKLLADVLCLDTVKLDISLLEENQQESIETDKKKFTDKISHDKSCEGSTGLPVNDLVKSEIKPVVSSEQMKRETLKLQLESKYEPVQTQFEPVNSKFDLVNGKYEPVKSQYEPVKSQYEPVKSQIEAVKTNFEPIILRRSQPQDIISAHKVVEYDKTSLDSIGETMKEFNNSATENYYRKVPQDWELSTVSINEPSEPDLNNISSFSSDWEVL